MPSLPIILAHGYLGFPTLGPFSYFNHVASLLAQMGAREVHATDVSPKGSLAARSSQLAEQIGKYVPNGRVHLIAHSMGGLDARYLIGHGKGREMIATLTTLGTPFRGTLAADVAADPLRLKQIGVPSLLAAIGRYEIQAALVWPFEAVAQTHFALGELRSAVEGLARGDYSHVARYFTGLFTLEDAALRELTTANCRRLFSDDEGDLQGIATYSYAGCVEAARTSPFLSASAILLDAVSQRNDGIVPEDSAKLRNHKGTLPVDHLGLVGWSPSDVSQCYRQIYATLMP